MPAHLRHGDTIGACADAAVLGTCPDVTGEGQVNDVDGLLVRAGMILQQFGLVIHRFDVDHDGDVDVDDLLLVQQNLGRVCD